MDTYSSNTNDWMLRLVKKYQQNKRTYSVTTDAIKYLNDISLRTDNTSENSSCTGKAKQIKTRAKTNKNNEQKEGSTHRISKLA